MQILGFNVLNVTGIFYRSTYPTSTSTDLRTKFFVFSLSDYLVSPIIQDVSVEITFLSSCMIDLIIPSKNSRNTISLRHNFSDAFESSMGC